MDFRAQKMDFQEVDRRHAELARQHAAGEISAGEFEAQSRELMVLDDDGRWWVKEPSSGAWNYHDGTTWSPGTPPGYGESAAAPTVAQQPPPGSPAAQAESAYPGAPQAAPAGRRRGVWRWLLGLLVALAILAFVGVAIVALLFFVADSGLELGQQPGTEPQSAEPQGGGASSGEEDASAGGGLAAVGFDAAFVHTSTADNVLANSTYLDHPLLNGNPDAVVYVTQNWNPSGSGGTYNDHPVGVWYNENRERWAVFNQDREPMPESVAFNVAVLAKAPEQQ